MLGVGVYVGTNPADLTQYENWLGRTANQVLVFNSEASWDAFSSGVTWAINKWKPVDKPVIWSIPLLVQGATLKNAANGDYNSYYVQAAQQLAKTRPGDDAIVIRTGWEADGDWMKWAAKGNETDYINAYRQFVEAFRSVSDRFVFDWSVTVGGNGMDPTTFYPGDAYVDIIGLDVYYSPTWDHSDPSVAFDDIVTEKFGLQWQVDFARAHNKEIAFSEWGVKVDGADAFVEKMAAWINEHDVLYANYWNSDGGGYEGKLSDGRYPSTGAAYRDMFAGNGAAAVYFPDAPALAASGTVNTVVGTTGDDSLYGDDANNRMDGGTGADRLSGGKGDDVYLVENTGDAVVESAGNGTDRVESWLRNYILPSGVEHLTLMTSTGQEGIGNEMNNRIVGGTGNDILNGKAGNDWLTGKAGNDLFLFEKLSGRDVITDFQAGSGAGDVVQLSGLGFTSFAQVKASMIQEGADTILCLGGDSYVKFLNLSIGQFAADDFTYDTWIAPPAPPVMPLKGPETWITGTTGNDTLTGDFRNNYIHGRAGNDTMIGGAGDDTYVVEQEGDRITEQADGGIDRVEAWLNNFTLPSNVEHVLLKGAYNHTLTGNGLDNKIEGSANADIINAKGGNDLILGNGGRDTFIMERGAGQDVIVDFETGDLGDIVTLKGLGFTSFAAVKAAMVQEGFNTLLQLGNGDAVFFQDRTIAQFTAANFSFDNTGTTGGTSPQALAAPSLWSEPVALSSQTSNAIQSLNPGSASLPQQGLSQIYVEVSGLGHVLQSWEPTATLPASTAHLFLMSAAGQTGIGNSLGNRIMGGQGNDVINGKAGNDWLSGGGGADVFQVERGTGHDTILDFQTTGATQDAVRLIGYGTTVTISQVLSNLAQSGSDTVLYLSGGDTVTFIGTQASDLTTGHFILG